MAESTEKNKKKRTVRSAQEIDESRGPFGSWLVATRKKMGRTQGEAANELGVHALTVCYWETGYQKPGMTSIVSIAQWANVDAMDLWGLVSGDIE